MKTVAKLALSLFLLAGFPSLGLAQELEHQHRQRQDAQLEEVLSRFHQHAHKHELQKVCNNSVQPLLRVLRDKRSKALVRIRATEALADFGTTGIKELRNLVRSGKSKIEKRTALLSIERQHNADTSLRPLLVDAAREAMTSPDPYLRIEAARILISLGQAREVEQVLAKEKIAFVKARVHRMLEPNQKRSRRNVPGHALH